MTNFLTNTAKNLKSAQNILISRLNIEPISFTTTAIRRNFATELNMIGIQTRITNDDQTNNCVVRLHSPNGAQRIVPPKSSRTINEWFEELHVEPDGTTGTGQIEVELVRPEDARRQN